MKHESLISLDEAAFGFGTPKAVFEATSAAAGDAADFITVPDAHLLFSGEFKHVGNDLKIIGEDGKSFLVTDYFKTDKHPTLRSPEGATLNGDLVDLLAGPLAPGQYAQAGAQQGTAEAVGRVAVVTGNVTVIRNGVAITVNAGDVILKNDVVQTGAGATCGLALNDGSTFNIAAGARLAINEFVYDPNGSANSSLVTLIQGAATFVAGQVAKTGDMKVATPVATMGIRGTAVILDINAADGRVSISVIDQRDNQEHRVEVFDRAGNLIATATSIGGRLVLTPTATLDVIASFTGKTAEQVAAEFAAFQAVLSSYDAAKQFFPNLPDHTDANPKGTQHAQGTDTQPPQGGSKLLPDSPTFGDKVVVREVVITTPADTSTDDDSGDGDTNPDPNIFEPDGPDEIIITTITGTPGDDTLTGTPGNDIILAGPGNDTILAGHGGGDDRYDGGTDTDWIRFPSADALQPLVFHLHGFASQNTVDGPQTGHDIFTNIEKIESGDGDDTFYVYGNTNWHIDADGGIDTVVLVGDLDITDETDGPDISHLEIIDLNATGSNTIDFDIEGALDMIEGNDTGYLQIKGTGADKVNLTNNDDQDGGWRLANEGDGLEGGPEGNYVAYVFDNDGQIEATVYIQDELAIEIEPESVPPTITVTGPEEILTEDEDGTAQALVTVSDPDSDVRYVLSNGWTPVDPGLGAQAHNGHYYAFFTFDQGTVSWTDAQDSARANGGDLATITSAAENAFVLGLIDPYTTPGENAAFIGGSDASSEGLWYWSSGLEGIPYFWNEETDAGSYGQFENWRNDPLEPNGGSNENHLVMEGDGTWNDAADNHAHAVGYVIEFANYRMDGKYGYAIFNTANGTITYHLDNNDADTQALGGDSHATDAFQIAVTDGDTTVTKTVSFAIEGVNDAPVTDEGSTGGNEDTVISVVLTGSDIEGALSAFRVTTLPANGTLYTDAAGTIPLGDDDISTDGGSIATIYFRPDADWNGRTTLYYAAVDGDGAQDASPASYIIDVAAVDDGGPSNEPPVINIDAFQGEPTSDDGGPEIALDDVQSQSTIVKLSDGSFVVVWNDLYEAHQNLRAQHFASNGTPLDEPFQVTTGGTAYPYENVLGTSGGNVAVLPDGTLFVTYYNPVSGGGHVYGQFFNTSGPIGEPAEIATGDGEQSQPKVTTLWNGDLLVTWTEPHGSADADVFGRVVRLRGDEPELVSNAFEISAGQSGYNSDASVVSVAPGIALVVWQQTTLNGNADVTAALLDVDITSVPSVLGAPFQINVQSADLQVLPTVAKLIDNTGDGPDRIVVTWTSDGNPEDESEYGVFGRIYEWNAQTASLVPVSDEFQVNKTIGDDQLRSTVTALMDGGFVVTWENDPDGGFEGNPLVAMQRFGFDGEGNPVKIDDEIVVATNGRAPDVAGLYDGAFAVTWLQFDTEGQVLGIKARVYDGSSIVTGIAISDPDAGDSNLTVTVTAAHGTIAAADDEVVDGAPEDAATLSFTGTLSDINGILDSGIIYTPDGSSVDQAITLTVDDGNGGSDVTNFIFNDYAPNGATLEGTDEKDVIFTTGQSDTITGGLKADTFVFDEDLIGNDTITDFDVSEDRMVFTSTEFSSFEELQLADAITYADGTATINFGEDGTVVLNGVLENSLQANNFVFLA